MWRRVPRARASWRRLRPRNWPVRWRLAAVSAGLTLIDPVVFGARDRPGRRPAGSATTSTARCSGAAQTLAARNPHRLHAARQPIVRGPDLDDFVRPDDASARIFDVNGNLIEREHRRRPRSARRELGLSDYGGDAGRDRRRPQRQAARSTGYVQYGRSVEHVDSTIDRLWLFIAAGVLGGTLLASLAGLAIAGRAMRPISSLTATRPRDRRHRRPLPPHAEPQVDDEVGELARTLEQMLRSLDAARAEREAAMKKQREFVADASHELRTPLTSVLANLELLQASLERARPGRRAGDGRLGAALLAADEPPGRRPAAARPRRRRPARRRTAAATSPRSPATPRPRSAPLIGDRELRGRERARRCRSTATPTSCTGWSSTCSTTPPATRRRARRIELRLRAEDGERGGRGRRRRPRHPGRAARARSSTASSAATGPPTPPPAPAAASAWRSSSAVAASHGGSVEVGESDARRRPLPRPAARCGSRQLRADSTRCFRPRFSGPA